MLKNVTHSNLFLLLCLVANLATLPALTASASASETSLSNDDTEFVFVGRCPSGDQYRLFSYQMDVDGLMQSFYDYEGPAGKGTVRTNTPPKKMLTRLCRNLADINDGSKFD